MQYERNPICDSKAKYKEGFADGKKIAVSLIEDALKDAIQNGTIVIEKGADRLFETIRLSVR